MSAPWINVAKLPALPEHWAHAYDDGTLYSRADVLDIVATVRAASASDADPRAWALVMLDTYDRAGIAVERPVERRMHRNAPMRAVLRAGGRVRGGFMHWLRGAPTHVLAELLQELERDGWMLVKRERFPAPREDDCASGCCKAGDVGLYSEAVR